MSIYNTSTIDDLISGFQLELFSDIEQILFGSSALVTFDIDTTHQRTITFPDSSANESIAYLSDITALDLQRVFDNSPIPKTIDVGSNPLTLTTTGLGRVLDISNNSYFDGAGFNTYNLHAESGIIRDLHIRNGYNNDLNIKASSSFQAAFSTIMLPGNTNSSVNNYILRLLDTDTGRTEWTDDNLSTKADIAGDIFLNILGLYSNSLMHNVFTAEDNGDFRIVGQLYLNDTMITVTATQINNIPNYLLKSGGTISGTLELNNDLVFNDGLYISTLGSNTLSANASFILPNNQLSALSGYYLSILEPVTGETQWRSSNLSGVITSINQATSFGSFTSAQILAGCTDETGTGLLTFNISPTFSGTVTIPTGLISSARVGDTIYITNAVNPSTFITGNDFTGNNQFVILRALNALTAGGRIILGQGTYIITSRIAFPDFPYFISGTNGVIIQSGYNGTMFYINDSDNVTFAELTFIIPEFGILQELISYNTNNLVFDRCKIISYRSSNNVLIVITSSINFLMTDCIIDSTSSTSTGPILAIYGTTININNLQMSGNPNNLGSFIQTKNSKQAIISNSSFRNGKVYLNLANKPTTFNSCIFVDAQINCQSPNAFPFIELNDCNISGPTLNNSLIFLSSPDSNATFGISTNNCTWSGGTTVIRYFSGSNLPNIYLNSRCNKGDYVTLELSGPVLQGNLIIEQPLTILTKSQLPTIYIPMQSVAYTSDYGYVYWDGSIWKSSADNSNLSGVIQTVGNVCSFGSFTSAQILAGCSDETGTGLMVFNNSPTFTGNIVFPTGQTWPTFNQNTTGNSATVTTNANLSGIITSVGNVCSFGSFTSAQILAGCTNETGTGLMVFNNSPTFTGVPLSTTPTSSDNSTKISTTAFVKNQAYATLDSPAFTGTPTAPTPGTVNNTTRIATTAFVKNQAYATLDSPAFTGLPLAPTAIAGTNTTQIATTSFVSSAISSIPSSSLQSLYQVATPQIITSSTYPTLGIRSASSSFSDNCLTVSDSGSRITTQIDGNGSMIMNSYSDANITYPGGESYQISSGIYRYFGPNIAAGSYSPSVFASLLNTTIGADSITWKYSRNFSYTCTGPLTVSAFYFSYIDIGFINWVAGPSYSGNTVATLNTLTLNPTNTVINSPSFTGVPSSTTATPGSNTTQIATTAFVTSADNLKANIASPTFTGIPSAPTATFTTNNTQIATTAFVKNQGYSPIASPAFTGTPTAPTAPNIMNSTQIATTAFVKSNLSSYLPLAGGTLSGVLSSLNILPVSSLAYNLGSATLLYLNAYLSNAYINSLYLAGTLLTSIGNGLTVNSGALTGYILKMSQVVVSTPSGPFYPGVGFGLTVPGLTISITPKTTSSKIRLDCSICFGESAPGTIGFVWARYDAGTFLTTKIGVGSGGSYNGSFRSEVTNIAWAANVCNTYIDSPGSTAALTYSLLYMVYNGTIAVYFNRSGSAGGGDNINCISTITVTELAS